ncbi:MAG: ABC transporter ATP-binding protein [Treponema sp.]|jgi:peptide/nickel transport system ATP-binding protein|nr:ABC transporter ATP-binding protein [Treponema sp.]
MADRLLEVQGLSTGIRKGGDLFTAVDNISFRIDEGEIVGLAGESGCGKTLTALSIPNLLPRGAAIVSGEIIYDYKSLASLSKREMSHIMGREISVIFQEARQALNPLMRSGDQITETLELSGGRRKRKNKKIALELLERLGFDEPRRIFSAFPHQLSGGMCQRVMAAIAAVCRPRLLLADEPSTALDAASQEQVFSLLTEMNRGTGTAILLISHDLSVIQKFTNRFLVMYAGKIVEEGPSQSLLSPLHPYTKALIGAIPGKDKKGEKLQTIPGKVPSIEDRFSGCPFAPRCRKAQGPCTASFPPEKNNFGQKVFCYFPEGAAGE